MERSLKENDPALSPTQTFEEGDIAGKHADTPADDRAALAKFDAEMLAQRIGQYRVVRRIGRGGMGVVYEAVHEAIGQRAAVKTLNQEYSGNPAFVKRFLTEARVAVIAQHPGLVKVFDYGQLLSGTLYILMEFLEGETLATRLRKGGRLPLEVATRLARQIASAVALAHERDVLHRDLKPDNIFLVPDREVAGGERVKILDFGLAKILSPRNVPASTFAPLQASLGGVVGTPAYMAPEQFRADAQLSGKADVYSLGVILFEMLTGQLPFSADSFGELMLKHMTEAPPQLGTLRAEVPAVLAALLSRMLAKEAAQRPSMMELELELATLERSGPVASLPDVPPPRAASRKLAVWVGLGLLVAAAGSLLVQKAWQPLEKTAAVPSDMVRFPAGTYTMGSTAEQIAAAHVWCQRMVSDGCNRSQFDREYPRRQVAVPAFLIDRTEVDNEHFAAWLSSQPGLRFDNNMQQVYAADVLLADLYPAFGSGGIVHTGAGFSVRRGLERRPATQVTWDAADRYCRSQGKRLPAEAEWESAARSGRDDQFPWGDDEPRCDGVAFARHVGWACGHLNSGPNDVGVAVQDRSAQGVHDLAGNVSEWVADRFVEPEHADVDYRVVRGGDWHTPAAMCRAATRSRLRRTAVVANIGFRCAK